MARPFLKWVGGKRQLLAQIGRLLPPDMDEIRNYVEPFVGGGAVLFHLLERYKFNSVHVSDLNPELILCYQVIQENARRVSEEIECLNDSYPQTPEGRKDVYYANREAWNEKVGKLDRLGEKDRIKRAAMTIFLNKTCFNGLFRVNKSGKFNVPIGGYERISIPKEEDLISVQESLQGVEIRHCSFTECESVVDSSTFVYFDPPYRPISRTSFVSYSKEGFGDAEQGQLAELFARLDSRGAKLMLSNSYDDEREYIHGLFEGYSVELVRARRSINRLGDERGEVSEVVIRNY